MSDDLAQLNKANIKSETQASMLRALRTAAKTLRKDAKNFAGSKLKVRTGETARRIKVGARKEKTGASLTLRGSGALNIWEHGRKAYQVPSKENKRVKMPSGKILNISPRSPIRIPAAGPRSVLEPALSRNETNIKNLVSEEMVRTIEELMPDKIEIYAADKVKK